MSDVSLLRVAVEAAHGAGDLIQQASQRLDTLNIEQKSLNDFVSEVDRDSESLIRGIIMREFPGHSIVGEEFGADTAKSSELTWFIDPLDGTTNFLRSIKHYAVSIAVFRGATPLASVIFDPCKGELFTAMAGAGAFLNDTAIRVSDCPGLSGALLATGVPYSGEYLKRLPEFLDTTAALLGHQTCGIRRLGSAALDLAYVASGRYDGFWEAGLKPWDIAAGMLLVNEAGGIWTDFFSSNSCLETGDIVAANAQVHAQMLDITSSHYAV